MKRKTIETVQIVAIAVAMVFVLIATWATVPYLTGTWGCAALAILGDVSAILFGVFGIWLGMFYRPDICDEIKGKSEKILERTARHVIENAKRFDVVFRGMKTSALVLVFSMVVRTLKDPIMNFGINVSVLSGVKFVFTFFVYWAILFQSYAVIMAISPMLDAKRKMNKARDDAEFALNM